MCGTCLSPVARAQRRAANEVSSSLPPAPSSTWTKEHATTPENLYPFGEKDISIGVAGQLTTTRTVKQQYIQGATPSVSLLATFHHQIRPFVGYNVNFGYTRATENYQHQNGITNSSTGVTTGDYARGSIPNNLYEISSAYVWKRPQLTTRFQPFVQAGGGVLIFSPTEAPFKGHASYRAAFLFGAGVDYRLSNHLGMRLEYRGLTYKYPDFGAVISTVPVSKAMTVLSLPSISFTYRFGKRGGMQ
ncbi:MAG: outer membrane beta-barrel protein [Acidobacteria bacterium]|nr:outer membrane beta-barrel protein [Acidobacteriota bacterium]